MMKIEKGKISSSPFLKAKDFKLTRDRVPVLNYTSQEVFEEEREKVFKRSWLCVGRENELPDQGSYFTREIPTIDASVVIVRGDDNVIRAFHNTCSHRGVSVVKEGCGKAKRFQCPYHAWVYKNNGELLGLPCEADFPQIDKSEQGLSPLAIESWNGFIFIHLDKNTRQSLSNFLGEFGEVYDGVPFDDYRHGFRIVLTLDCNWKSMVDAFSEGYHLPFLHKNTLKDQTATKENPFIHYHDPRFMGLHSVATLERNYEWRPTEPVQSFVLNTMPASHTPDITNKINKKNISGHPGVNPSGINNFSADNATVFPNLQIHIMISGYLTHQFWPLGPDKMVMETRIYSEKIPSSFREKFADAYMQSSGRDVVTEDSSMSVLQQKGLASGGNEYLYFGENELMLRRFADLLAEYIEQT